MIKGSASHTIVKRNGEYKLICQVRFALTPSEMAAHWWNATLIPGPAEAARLARTEKAIVILSKVKQSLAEIGMGESFIILFSGSFYCEEEREALAEITSVFRDRFKFNE